MVKLIRFYITSLTAGKDFFCSVVIVPGFFKEGDFSFGKPAEDVLPADFDNSEFFEEVKDI